MAELVFYYGTMSSSKTANALMTRFQYLERGLKVWLIKPAIDNRTDVNLVSSRVGLEAKADAVLDATDDIFNRWHQESKSDLIICDEAQFLTEAQIDQLKALAETTNITVYCYGLRTDFKTKLFPGSKRLFEICSRAIEIPSICSCGKPAIINAKYSKGKLVTSGAQIDIGGDEKYKAICYDCYIKAKEEAEKRG